MDDFGKSSVSVAARRGQTMFKKALDSKVLADAASKLQSGTTVRLTGLWGSASPLVAATLGTMKNVPMLFIARHGDDADDVADDIEVFTDRDAHLFPAWEVDIGTDHVNEEISGERLGICNMLSQRSDEPPAKAELLVAPIMALLQPVPSVKALAQAKLRVQRGDLLAPDSLSAWLIDAGFERVEQVDRQGQFAMRGGIVDIFAMAMSQAARVEFFGDEIASIRLFDLDTQRSSQEIDAIELTAMSAGREFSPDEATTLLSYLPANTIVCMHEPSELAELAAEIHGRLSENGDHRSVSQVYQPQEVFSSLGEKATVEMYSFGGRGKGRIFDLGIRSLERLSVNTYQALHELTELSATADVWIYCENQAERERFADVLAKQHPALSKSAHLTIGHVSGGFYWPGQKAVAVGHHEIFRRYSKVRRIRRVRAGRPIESLLDLNEGDVVVHLSHGIAKFDGLKNLQSHGKNEEFLTLRFADNAVLHVPASRIDLVQKYIGAGRKRPSLSKLGGASWQRQKDRAAVAVKDLAAEMLRLQAMREAIPGVSFPKQTEWQRQFADEFLYTETPDQLAAIQQIDHDMLIERPMDRLLCGDVGYGKTELAMRAAFKIAEAGKQTAVLVPTTVLADQHYRTFRERMADYPMNVEMLSRFRSAAKQAEIVKKLALGQIDILIGTHRLLSKDVRFPDLGLVVIDEEQRFGVEHKERLKAMRSTVEVLTMTATPIPRTLHMALLGLRDISALATAPLDRRAIHTEVCHYDEQLVRKAILRELNRGGQAFFVHNRVADIQALADRIGHLVPDARIAVGHGQMPEKQLEQTMLRFVRQEIDVLVCTTIIESGLDIATANTMVIHNADRFGLAELHQLRGRVGRYKHRAYCYLLLPETRSVSSVAARRLKAIEEFSDLGAGFQIAMRDLEIRGAGNILGHQQSGYITAVGYELYCQLLERAVAELSGKPTETHRDVHLELGIDLYIPRWYVPADRQRMEIYRRMVKCRRPDELQQLAADLVDAYGKYPPIVQNVLDLAEIRVLAGELGINGLVRTGNDIVFSASDVNVVQKSFGDAAGTVRCPDKITAHWRPPSSYLELPTLITVLLRRLRQAVARL